MAAGGSQSGLIQAGRDASVSTAGSLAANVTAGRDAFTSAIGGTSGSIVAGVDAAVAAWGSVSISLVAGRDASAWSGGSIVLNVGAARDVAAISSGILQLVATAGRDLDASSVDVGSILGSAGGNINVSSQAAGLFTLASTLGNVSASTVGPLMASIQAPSGDVTASSLSTLAGSFVAGSAASVSAVSHITATHVVGTASASLAAWGNADGFVVESVSMASAFSYGEMQGAVRSSLGMASAIAGSTALVEVTGYRDAFLLGMGYTQAQVSGVLHAEVIAGGSLAGTVNSGFDARIIGLESVNVTSSVGNDLTAWSRGNMIGHFTTGRDLWVASYGSLDADFHATRDIAQAWSRGDLSGVLQAGQKIWVAKSFGSVNATLTAPIVGGVEAFGSVQGSVTASQIIGGVRTAGLVLATLSSPTIGSIRENDHELQSGYPSTPDASLALVRAMLNSSYRDALGTVSQAAAQKATSASALAAAFASAARQADFSIGDVREAQAYVAYVRNAIQEWIVLTEAALGQSLIGQRIDNHDGWLRSTIATTQAYEDALISLRQFVVAMDGVLADFTQKAGQSELLARVQLDHELTRRIEFLRQFDEERTKIRPAEFEHRVSELKWDRIQQALEVAANLLPKGGWILDIINSFISIGRLKFADAGLYFLSALIDKAFAKAFDKAGDVADHADDALRAGKKAGRIAGKGERRGINAAERAIKGEGRKAIEIGAKHLDDPLRKCARGLECFSPETLVMTGAFGSEDADQTDLAWSDAEIVSLATDTDNPGLGRWAPSVLLVTAGLAFLGVDERRRRHALLADRVFGANGDPDGWRTKSDRLEQDDLDPEHEMQHDLEPDEILDDPRILERSRGNVNAVPQYLHGDETERSRAVDHAFRSTCDRPWAVPRDEDLPHWSPVALTGAAVLTKKLDTPRASLDSDEMLTYQPTRGSTRSRTPGRVGIAMRPSAATPLLQRFGVRCFLLLLGAAIAWGICSPARFHTTHGEQSGPTLQFASAGSVDAATFGSPALDRRPPQRLEVAGKPIREIRLGDRIAGQNPIREQAELVEPDPLTWRHVRLFMRKESGLGLWIELLRPLSWVEAHGAEPGARLYLAMPELGAVGAAEVTYLGPCPEIRTGEGTVVTGTFQHQADASSNVLHLALEDQPEPTTVTSNHPYWSEDRQDFVAVGNLRAGELVDTAYGLKHVVAATSVEYSEFLYNLETTEHVYRVGSLGTLVHNNYPGDFGLGGAKGLAPRSGGGLVPRLQGNIPQADKWIRNGGRVIYHTDGSITYIKNGVSIRYNSVGYPDFSKHLYKGTDGLNQLRITLTGSRPLDEAAANAAAGFKHTPDGFSWHHHEHTGLMQLVHERIHGDFWHSGGFSLNK